MYKEKDFSVCSDADRKPVAPMVANNPYANCHETISSALNAINKPYGNISSPSTSTIEEATREEIRKVVLFSKQALMKLGTLLTIN